jgi:prepilin-type N-terminal cleavage/methylation domain-containing protein
MRSKLLANRSRGFSLVEMLVVLTIMGILSALTVSSISSLRSTVLSATGNQLVDVFAMARQNSLTKNGFTAVVVRAQGTGACSAYCLLQLVRQDDGTFGSWTELSPWRYLPAGVVFENNQTTIDTFMLTAPALPSPLPTSYLFQGSPIDLTAAGTVVQCYQPDGTLINTLSNGHALQLRLIEGKADTTGSVTYSGATVAGAQVSYYDLFFIANTGITKIGRL